MSSRELKTFAMLQSRFTLRNPSLENPTTTLLFLRRDGHEMQLSTKLSIHAKFWNKENKRAKKSWPEFKHINGVLNKLESQVKKEILSFCMLRRDWSMRDLKKRVKGELPSQLKEQNFSVFFQSFIDSRVNVNSKGSIISY